MQELSEKEQKELINKAKLNKKDFDKIYLFYNKKIYDFVKKRVSNQFEAEDLTSEIFEKIMKSLPNFQWQGITLSAWIFRIARNAIIDSYRKNSKRKKDVSIEKVSESLISSEIAIEMGILQDEMQAKLYDAIREFNEEEQYLIYYKFFAEMSNKDIAELTKMSETNVGTKLHRIRIKLKKFLADFNDS